MVFNICSHLQAQSQSGTENSVRDRVFERALIKAYHENPRIYEAHSKALEGKWQAFLQKVSLSADRESYKFWRMLPDPTSVLKEKGLLDWEKRKQDYDIEKRRQMNENPKRVEEVAKSIRKQLYSSKPSEHVAEVYNVTKLHEGSEKLPNPVGLDGLQQQYPDLVNDYDKMGFTNEQRAQFCSGQMTKKEFMAIINVKTEDEYNLYIQNTFLVFPKADGLPSKSDVPSQEEKNEKALKKEKLNKHNETVVNAEANLYAGTAVLALIDPKSANQISQAGNAAIKVYDAVGSMLINGAIDPTGIGNIASGVGVIASLLDKTPSFNNVVVGMLNQILENQRLMLIKLNEIEIKVDLLQANIDYLLRVTDYNHIQILNEITDIKKRLADLEYRLLENREVQKLISQEHVIREFQRRKGAIILEFYNDAGSLAWQNRIDAIQNPEGSIDYDTRQYFNKINTILNELAYFGTVQLEDKTYSTFTERSNIERLEVVDIKLKLKTDINQLVGLLPSMGEWLNSHMKGPIPFVEYNDNYIGEKLDGKGLNVNIGNPAIFSFILNEYIDLALYRPINHRVDGSVINDPNITAFCEDFHGIKAAIEQMKTHIPLAIAVFNFHLRRLKNTQETFVSNYSRMLRIAKKDNNGRELIYYPGMSVEFIEQELTKLTDDEFLILCDSMQVIKRDSVIKSKSVTVVASAPMAGAMTETVLNSHWYVELINAMRDKYKFNNRHEYLKSIYSYNSYRKGQQLYPRMQTLKLNSVRGKFNNIIAREIYDRQVQVSQAWQRELNGNQNLYLGGLYKANFILKTLVEGGYGHSYSLIDELKSLTEIVRQIDEMLSRIESWSSGTDVFDDEKSIRLFSEYFKRYSRLEENDKSSQTLKSFVVPINIPERIDNPFLFEIGNIQAAFQALMHASWYEDISPQKECLYNSK